MSDTKTRGVVLVTDPIGGDASLISAALQSQGFQTLVPTRERRWLDLAGEADGLIVNLVSIDASVIRALGRCRVIARLGVGLNNIDVAAATAKGIVITNVPDYCREEVSDHALALILAMVRKLPRAHSDVQRGNWEQLSYRPIHRLSTLTLGLIGFGRLAQALARKAAALGVCIAAHDPYVPQDIGDVRMLPLVQLLQESDIVSLHVPLTNETRKMIGREVLRTMKAGAILVNTSRGELIDEAALIAALDAGHLAGAALDVVAEEPLPPGSLLRGRDDVLLTPHMAFYSEDSLKDLQRTAAEDVIRSLTGREPRHRV